MRDNYLSSFYSQARSELEGFKFRDPIEIIEQLRKGDYQMLSEIVKFENKATSTSPFNSYFSQKA